MRVLVASKFWYRRGGLERVMFDEIRWLEEGGHDVAHFSTSHPLNQPSTWQEYFAPYLELGAGAELSLRQKTVATGRMFWNREAARRFDRLLRDFKPDVVHLHGIHRQLSPSIVNVARRRDVPIVQTLHDYHPICPSDTLLRGGLKVCDPPACSSLNTLPCFRNRCTRGSSGASLLAAAEAAWRSQALQLHRSMSALIAPSRFLGHMVSSRISRLPPLHVLPNAVETRPARPPGDYFLYAGRLSAEKGVATLIRAAREAGTPLVILGDGPLRHELETAADGEVTFLGHVDGQSVDKYLDGARAAVVPSECFENAPLGVLEPMASGRAVVAGRIGGIPEMISDGVEGFLFSPGNWTELAEALRALSGASDTAERMGIAGLATVSQRFSPTAHLNALLAIYQSVAAR